MNTAPTKPAHTSGLWSSHCAGTVHAPHPSGKGLVVVADGWHQIEFNGVQTCEEAEANAARIVACVNACAGITDPAATLKQAREALAAVIGPDSTDCGAYWQVDAVDIAAARAAIRALGGE